MTTRTEQEPRAYTFDSVEDAEQQAEWEHMARIRSECLPRETVKPVPYVPDDRL
jgi:hypothetical protein